MPLDLGVITNEVVDVDFREQSSRHGFSLGYEGIGRSAEYFGAYEDVVKPIPQNEWRDIADEQDRLDAGLEWLVTEVKDQKKEGSCTSDATTQIAQILQAKQFGIESVVLLSAISLYKRVARSPGSGSTLSDNIDEVSTRGIVPLDNEPNRKKFGSVVMPNTGFYERLPNNWQNVAANFCITESTTIRTVEGIVTAGLKGDPTLVGRDGHSIVYIRPVWIKNVMYMLYINSWYKWGFAAGRMTFGFGLDSIAKIKKSAKLAFAPRAITVPTFE